VKNLFPAEEILKMVFRLVVNFTSMLPKTEEFEKMNTMELYLFLYVALNGPKKMSELANVLKTAKSNITTLVDNLEGKGYLKRERSFSDRRAVIIKLTEEGEKLYRKLLDSFQSLVEKVIAKVPQKDLEEISEGFFKMVSLFTEYSDSGYFSSKERKFIQTDEH